MRKDRTRLSKWLIEATPEQRERVAALSGTSVNYLYQLAACMREAKVTLAFAIEDATCEVGPFCVTARELATMCALDGLPKG